jgi:hypothetical protein
MPAMHAKRKHEWTAAELISALRDVHVGGADLKALAQLTQELANEDLDRRVVAAKQSRDGAGLPVEVLRRQIVGLPIERSYNCECRAALRWLND